MNVALPPYMSNSSGFHTYPSPLETSSSPTYNGRPSPTEHLTASRDQVMYDYDEARRNYYSIIQRERAELDQSKHEVDALTHEKLQLRRDLAEAENRAASLARERDIANAKLVSESAGLRAENSRMIAEISTLKDQLKKTHESHTAALVDRSQLESMIASLRAEAVAAGRAMAEQASTIRALTGEMSRRDPYHLVKEIREGRSAEATAVNTATLEDRVRFLEGKLATEKAEYEKTIAASQQDLAAAKAASLKNVDTAAEAFRSELASVKAKLSATEAELDKAKREKDTYFQHATEAATAADKLTAQLETAKKQAASDRLLSDDLAKQLEALRKDNQQHPPLKSVPVTNISEEERREYDTLMYALRQDAEDLKLQLRSAFVVLDRVERGEEIADVKTAKLVNVTLTVEGAIGLLERDQKSRGLQDPFVRVLNPLGDVVIETDPANDTTSPTFDKKNSATIRLARGSKSSVRIEVWTKGMNGDNGFLGCVLVSAKSLLDGGSAKHSLTLGPREGEVDSIVLSNAKALGSVTLNAQITPAGASPVKVKAPEATRQTEVKPVAEKEMPKPQTPAKPQVQEAVPQPAQSQPVLQPTKPSTPIVQPVATTQPTVQVAPAVAARSQPKAVEKTDVIFRVVSCRAVMCRDPMGTKSDPYVKITRPGAKEPLFETSRMQDTCDPVWPPNEKSTKTITVDPEDKTPFVFEVWDDDSPRSDDFLGQGVIDVSSLLSGSGVREMKLQPRADEPDTDIVAHKDKLGFVTVDFTIVGPHSASQEKPAKPSADATAAAATRSAEKPAETPKPTAQQLAAVATGPAQRYLLYVESASGLMTHTWSKTDPYVVVHDALGAECLSTKICPNTSEPKWNLLDASVQIVIAPSDTSFITFDVLDDEKIMGALGPKPKYLGFAKISANEILAQQDEVHRMKLRPRDNETEDEVKEKKDNLGYLTVRFSRVYAAPGGVAAEAAPGGASQSGTAQPGAAAAATRVVAAAAVEDVREVTFTVCGVKGVMGRNLWGGMSDVYCVIRAPGGRDFTTIVKDDCVNATWDGAEGTTKYQLSQSSPGAITVDVMDKYKGIGSDCFLGFVSIPISEVFLMNGKPPKTFKLTMKPGLVDKDAQKQLDKGGLGEITIKASVSGMASSERVSTMLAAVMTNRIAPPSTSQPFQVNIWVKGCANLLNRQVNGDISDPFVITRGPRGEERPTPTIENNLNPMWDAASGTMKAVTVDPKDDGFIVFDVMDVGHKTGQLRLGSADLRVQDLIKEGLGERVFRLYPGWKQSDPEILANQDKLGTLTVLITPTDVGAAAAGTVTPSVARPAADVPAERRPFVVQVISASVLKRHTMPSPYVEVRDSSQAVVLATDPVPNTLTPLWDGPNSAKTVMLSALDNGSLTFSVFTESQNGKTPMGIAQLSIGIATDPTKPNRWELPLTVSPTESDAFLINNKDQLGKIVVEVRAATGVTTAQPSQLPLAGPAALAPPAQAAPPAQVAPAPPQKITFAVCIKHGKNLLRKDVLTSDPLVRFYKNDELVVQTAVKDSTLNPEWNQVSPFVTLTKPSNDTLKFVVLDQDKAVFGGALSFEDMGAVTVPGNDAISWIGAGDKELKLSLQGKDAGSLFVAFNLS